MQGVIPWGGALDKILFKRLYHPPNNNGSSSTTQWINNKLVNKKINKI